MTLPPQWVAVAGAAPALVAMWYFDRRDRACPVPAGFRRKVAIFGGLSVIVYATRAGLGFALWTGMARTARPGW